MEDFLIRANRRRKKKKTVQMTSMPIEGENFPRGEELTVNSAEENPLKGPPEFDRHGRVQDRVDGAAWEENGISIMHEIHRPPRRIFF